MNKIDFKNNLSDCIKRAVVSRYKGISNNLLDNIELVVPNIAKYGDLSTNFCLAVSKELKQSANEVSLNIKLSLDEILKSCQLDDCIDEIKIEGAGFLNFYLSSDIKSMWLEGIYNGKYFNDVNKIGKRQKISIEFVSANPTGPITIAHARQAVVGDSISNIFEFCGYKITREYYINDEGRQILLLGESVKARCKELLGEKVEIPDGGYKGTYIIDIARKMLNSLSSNKIKADKYIQEVYSKGAVEIIIDKIKCDLENIGVMFNKWCRQSNITSGKKIKQLFKKLEHKQYIYGKDGASWFKSSLFNDEKDRVLVKKDGEYTYFAPDIAYHYEKLSRSDRVINIWGPDHHGYIPRMKAVVEALGYNQDALNVLIVQLTTVYSKGKPISMSKREGEFATLEDIFKAVGKDVTRFFLLMRKLDSHLNFDLELAKEASMNNPVFYIQYAHARICNIIKNAKDEFKCKDFKPKFKKITTKQLKMLNTDIEKELINKLIILPDEILIFLRSLEPYRIATYLQELASIFHRYYSEQRVLSSDKELTLSRLYLCQCTGIILKQGLNLLGVKAPRSM